uniref:Uncharacterized protein n=1 Tax=Ascaris lumbricoides TaxID=6252 RepID=A0A0M3IDP2_ASCLU
MLKFKSCRMSLLLSAIVRTNSHLWCRISRPTYIRPIIQKV